MLPALTGNLGRPGSGWAYVTGSDSRRIDRRVPCRRASLLADPPPPVSQMDLADVLADPTRAQALFCWNINIAASNPRLGDLRRALEREDLLTVVLDLFQTDTADLADFVLPAASFLESDDLVCSYFHHTLSAQVRAADPPGEALPNSEIFRRLSAAIGYTEPELYESDREVIDELLRRTGFGVSWDELASAGTVRLYETPRLQFADRRFPTPSGRVELASAAAVAAGPSATTRTVARPTPGKRSPAPALACLPLGAQLELRQRPQDRPQTRAADRHPEPRRRSCARPHRRRPRRPRNPRPDGCAPASSIDPLALPGVAYCPKGHWPKRTADNANVNTLNPGDPADMARSTSVHGIEITVAQHHALEPDASIALTD